MSTAFPLFTRFPREVQDLIWDAAVRPVSGSQHVQRFMIADHHFDPANPQWPVSGDFIRFGRQDGPRAGYALAIPWDDPNGNTNESVYALDSGLWTACTASRSAMERFFKKNEWWSDLPTQERAKGYAMKGAYAGQYDVFHSATYKTREGERRHITINTEDLIYLDPRRLNQTDWFHHYAGDTVPLIDRRGPDSDTTNTSFLGLNIAIDYGPEMMEALDGGEVHHCREDLGLSDTTIIDMLDTLHGYAGRTIWFIDHRLRPKQSDSSDTDWEGEEIEVPDSASIGDRQVFHAEDYTLVEVLFRDLEQWAIDADGHGASNDDACIFEFFDLLARMTDGRLESDNPRRIRRALAYQPKSDETPRPPGPYENIDDPACPVCHPKEEERVRPVRRSTSEDSGDDVSTSDLNLFD